MATSGWTSIVNGQDGDAVSAKFDSAFERVDNKFKEIQTDIDKIDVLETQLTVVDKKGIQIDTLHVPGLYEVSNLTPDSGVGMLKISLYLTNQELHEYTNYTTSARYKRTYNRGTTTFTAWVQDSLTSNLAQIAVNTEDIEDINTRLTATYEPNGFDRRFPQYMGIIECCTQAVTQTVDIINEMGVWSRVTGQITFGDGATPLADRTLIVRPGNSGEFHVWVGGVKHVYTDTQVVSVPVPTAGVTVFYFNASGVLSWGVPPIEGLYKRFALVGAVTCNTNTGKKIMFRDERHGNDMDGTTHDYLHNTFGTRWVNGATINGVVDNATDYTTIDAGLFYDEDLPCPTASFAATPFWYREGVGGQWTSSAVQNTKLGYQVTGTTRYNLDTGGTWSLAPIGASFVIMHIAYGGDAEFPYVKIVGQRLYATRDAARAQLEAEITLLNLSGLPSPELKFLYSMIIHNEATGQIETGTNGEVYIDWRYGYPTARF